MRAVAFYLSVAVWAGAVLVLGAALFELMTMIAAVFA